MKVLHILNELKFSGAEIMYVDAAPIFQEIGCDLSVLATANEVGEYAPYFERSGYQVYHYPMPSLKKYVNRIKFYIQIIKLLKKEKFNVVHIHSSKARLGFAFCAWRSNIRSVYTFHNVFASRFISYPYHLLQRLTAKYLFKCKFQTISESVYQNELKVYHNDTIKVNNWYDNSRYFPAVGDEKNNFRKELGISNSTLVLISVGGCSSVKRHTDIIEALSLILEKIPDCIYLHLGTGCSEVEEKLLANKKGIQDKIRFLGNQENVRKYLIVSDIYLMTSQFEGISLTTIEAMACSIPAILYNVPGLRDFNKGGVNSILIPEDFKVLANAIVEMVANPKGTETMINNAKVSVEQLYNMRTNATEIYKLYS